MHVHLRCNRAPGPYEDTIGPTLLATMLMVAIVMNFAIKIYDMYGNTAAAAALVALAVAVVAAVVAQVAETQDSARAAQACALPRGQQQLVKVSVASGASSYGCASSAAITTLCTTAAATEGLTVSRGNHGAYLYNCGANEQAAASALFLLRAFLAQYHYIACC
eukprot:20755-Heterococcus_DN1.PRE.3